MLASFSILLVGAGEELKEYVAAILDIIDKSGLTRRLGAIQTTGEGLEDNVIALIMECHRHVREVARRVFTHFTIDDRAGAMGPLASKVADVRKTLGQKLSRD